VGVVRARNTAGSVGSFAIDDLVALNEAAWVDLMRKPTPAHRLPETMAKVLRLAARRVVSRYDGNAANIWSDNPLSATIVRRFLEFHGAGPKIATMAANILVRHFHVPLRDYRYLDISADSQVQRVMGRLGFVEPGSSPEVIVYAARELNPEFPGIFDLALWDLGRSTCRPTAPLCSSCRLVDYCGYAAGHRD
jgi:endonuclease III